MNSPCIDAALVLATDHDWPTSFVAAAAREVHALLLMHGLYKPVPDIPYPGGDKASLYFELRQLTQSAVAGRQPPHHFVLGFLGAHGNNLGLFDGQGQLFFEPPDCDPLRGAILVVCACFKDGWFPRRATQAGTGPIRALIGFHRTVQIGERNKIESEAGISFQDYRAEFISALVQPVRSLLRLGCTVQQALNETKDAWNSLISQLCPHGYRWRVCTANRAMLDRWGDPHANL